MRWAVSRARPQGDVLLIARAGATPVAGIRRVLAETQIVLAEGEATGHAHRVVSPEAQLVELLDGGPRMLVLQEPAALTHEEHAPIELPAGTPEVQT